MTRKMVLIVAVLLASAWPAVAQPVTEGVNPAQKAPAQITWIGVAVGCTLAICVGVASLMSSKRGHQD